MFLNNHNNKYCDTSQSSLDPNHQHQQNNGSVSSGSMNFPTSLLESLLQNSDILETLMKPLSGAEGGDGISFDEKLFAKKLAENDDSTKIYGNAFLGPNLWSKSDLFPSDKFGVKLEYLDVQEFLAENDLNECDFLDELQNIDSKTLNNNNNKNECINNDMNTLPAANTLLIPPVIKQQQNSMSISGSGENSSSQSDFSLLDIKSPDFNDELRDLIQSNNNNNNKRTRQHVLEEDMNDDDENTSLFSDDNESCFLDGDDDDDDDEDDDDDDSMLTDEQLFAKMSKLSSEDCLSFEARLRKCRKQFIPNELKDEKYWNRRRKNNLAAKRSRDARRMKETQVALRAAFLERENSSLKRQLDECKRETRVLKTRLSRYENNKKQQQE